MKLCSGCKYSEPRDASVVCRNPKLNALAAMVDGVPGDGALADCLDSRLNSNMCGLDGSWFEATKPLPVGTLFTGPYPPKPPPNPPSAQGSAQPFKLPSQNG